MGLAYLLEEEDVFVLILRYCIMSLYVLGLEFWVCSVGVRTGLLLGYGSLHGGNDFHDAHE